MFHRRRHLEGGIVKAAVFGANDGIITTFAVVAGVSGARLPLQVVLILGISNMIADAISMGLGDFLGEKAERQFEKNQKLSQAHLTRLGASSLVTFISFIIAGSLPLIPFMFSFLFSLVSDNLFFFSTMSTASALFLVGSLRTFFTKGAWWKNGLEMLMVGALAASASYALGRLVETIVNRSGLQL